MTACASSSRDGTTASAPAATSAPLRQTPTCWSFSIPTRSRNRVRVAALARRLEDRGVGVAQARLRLLRPARAPQLERERPSRERARLAGRLRAIRRTSSPSLARSPTRAAPLSRFGPSSSTSSADFTEELFLYQEDLELCWRAGCTASRRRRAGGRRPARLRARATRPPQGVLPRAEPADLRPHRVLRAAAAPARAGARSRSRPGSCCCRVRQGWLREKVRGWAWLARNASWLAAHRRETQALRRGAGPRARALPDAGARSADARAARGHRAAERPRFGLVAGGSCLPLTLPSAR